MGLIVRLSEGEVGIIERQGKYHKTVFPGPLHFLVPAIDSLHIYKLKPITYKLPNFSLLVKGSFTIDVEVQIKYKIMEPWKARYEVENKDLEYTIERFIIKTLSSPITDMSLEEAITAQAELNELLKKQLNNISRNWGFKLFFVEILSMKKSFLAEQERDRLYDTHKSERGSYMSEKINLIDPTKAVHHKDLDEDQQNLPEGQKKYKSEIVDFNKMTDSIEGYQKKEVVDQKIHELETQLEEIDDDNIKELSRHQIDILRQHQEDMINLQEKDLKKQQEELMYMVQEMAQKQKDLIEKQNELVERQKILEEKKKEIIKTNEEDIIKLEEDNYKLKKIAITDTLTKLYNRGFFQTEVTKKLNIANENNSSIAIIMIDIDHFKQINDTYGHLAGDEALIKVSNIIKEYIGKFGLTCRYGGEEFAIAIIESDYKKGYKYADTLRKTIHKEKFTFEEKDIPLTISVGIAIKVPEETLELKQLIDKADKALYKAKEEGRNRTISFEDINT